MENPTVKSLRPASINSILDHLNRQCETVLTLDYTSLPGQQPGNVKIIIPQKKKKKNGFSIVYTNNEKNDKEAE